MDAPKWARRATPFHMNGLDVKTTKRPNSTSLPPPRSSLRAECVLLGWQLSVLTSQAGAMVAEPRTDPRTESMAMTACQHSPAADVAGNSRRVNVRGVIEVTSTWKGTVRSGATFAVMCRPQLPLNEP
jgi:hypothetical protein